MADSRLQQAAARQQPPLARWKYLEPGAGAWRRPWTVEAGRGGAGRDDDASDLGPRTWATKALLGLNARFDLVQCSKTTSNKQGARR